MFEERRPAVVSVIMIFLNEAQFIREAVASVLAQTYASWELLLVDDGSRDGSSEIARQFAQQYPEKVRYLEHAHHQNRGMSASRNFGIDQARGEYLSFLDADDVWLPNKLSWQVAALESFPEAGFVCGRAEWWYSWTGDSADAPRDFLQPFGVPLDTLTPPPLLLLSFLQNQWASLCDILVPRAVVKAADGYEESFRGMYEDQVFHTKLCLRWPALVSSTCGYRYRQHPKACTTLSHETGQDRAARLAFLNWLEAYLTDHGIKDARIWRILKRELRILHYPLLYRISGSIGGLLPPVQGAIEQLGRWTFRES
jgi:hypothetical protein